MRTQSKVGLGLLVVVVLSLFCVDETQVAIVTAFGPMGRTVRTVRQPGLHVKWPWQGRRKFDRRLQLYNARPSECLTADKKNLVIDWYVCWQIADPELFYASVRAPVYAELRLEETVRGSLTARIGSTGLDELIQLETEGGVKVAALTDAVREVCAPVARDKYGIDIADVRLRRLNLPEQNKRSVFDRMSAERERIARKYRAEGEEEARRIRAEADREKETILSEAYRDSERTRGEGDAEATRIYAAADNVDPAFYKFVRSLEATEKMFGQDTTVVLSANSPLLKTLTEGGLPGGRP